MAKFLFGLITGVVLCIAAFFLIMFALVRSFRESAPVVAQNSVLQLQLSGDIPERAPVEVPIGALAERPAASVTDIWMTLRKAAADSRMKAVALEPQSLSVGWGKLEEFRADLERFKKSGKPLYAFLKTPSARDYYLALAADRIYLGPTDWLDLKGMRVEIMYFKNTLDKIGVKVQVEHDGKYKDFGDMFTRTSMSPETREVLTSVIDDLFGNLLAHVAQARKKTPDEMRALIDQGPFLAQRRAPRRPGRPTALRRPDVRRSAAESERGRTASAFEPAATSGSPRARSDWKALTTSPCWWATAPSRAARRATMACPTMAFRPPGSTSCCAASAGDSSIDGVVVRIDSPGGDAVASDEIWREMNLLSKKKPLVISMSDAAASGGYYMAMTGDPVVAYPGTLTGSIGVVFGKPDLHGLYDKLGVTKDTIVRGQFARYRFGLQAICRPSSWPN